MNGYQITADSYKKLLESDQNIDRASVESKIRALDYLATATDDDRLELFNLSAFNDVVKGYVKMACNNVDLDDEVCQGLLNEISYLFDTVSAREAEAFYYC